MTHRRLRRYRQHKPGDTMDLEEALDISTWPNRMLCDVLSEMRDCHESRNYAHLLGLIEEAQVYANRMESALSDQKDYKKLNQALSTLRKEYKPLRDDIQKLLDEKKKLEKEIKELRGDTEDDDSDK